MDKSDARKHRMREGVPTRVKYICSGIAAVLLVAGTLPLAAQRSAKVAERVRTALIAEERGWQLDASAVEDQRFWHVWKKRDQRIGIDYAEYPSDMDARAWLEALPGRVAMPGYVPLTGVGDEALIFRLRSSGKSTIYFRKARYIASVTAPSETLATRIAKLLIAQLHE